jgi:hypothetical protein
MNRVNFLFISFLLFFLIPFPFRPFLFDPAIPRHVIRAQRDQEQQRRIEDESPLGRIQQLPGAVAPPSSSSTIHTNGIRHLHRQPLQLYVDGESGDVKEERGKTQ